MAVEIRMPKLGMAMENGVVVQWLKREGEDVVKDEDVAEISSEKIDATVTAPEAGTLLRIDVAEGAEVPVGTLLAFVGTTDDELPPPDPAGDADAVKPEQREAAREQTMPAPATVTAAAPASSPAARRRARELGVDVAAVTPSGPGQRITSEDVDAHVGKRADAHPGERADAPARGEVIPFTGTRAAVAAHMAESLRTTAQVTLIREVDAEALSERRAALADDILAQTGVRLSYTDLLVEAVGRTLLDHPRLNATLADDGVVRHADVHIGVAVALEDGLIVPVVRNAHRRSLAELAADRAKLAANALDGTLAFDDIEGGTFTITNLGGYGTDAFTPVLNLPQVAILGVGRIAERVVARDGQPQVRATMWLSLTFDHRAVDGAPASMFLDALTRALQDD